MMWYWGNGTQWWGWLIGVVVMVAFWGVIVWAIWYFVTSFGRQPEHGARNTDPKRILDERLARGEVDAEEYGRLRDLMERTEVHATNGQSTVESGGRR